MSLEFINEIDKPESATHTCGQMDQGEIGPQTQLWRYMELSKFMPMLIKGGVSIPTLSTLRTDSDPKEAVLPSSSEAHLSVFLFEGKDGTTTWDWLVEKIEGQMAKRDAASPELSVRSCFLKYGYQNDIVFDQWLDELSARRAVWCWASPHDPDGPTESYESLAMWTSYAKSGIAIRTTLGRIKEAFEESPQLRDAQGIAIRVAYRKQGYAMRELLYDEAKLKRPFRPYAFKNRSFDYEHEIRIVFRVNGEANVRGVSVEIDPNRLLHGGKVVVSPYTEPPEADELVKHIKRLLKRGGTDPQIDVHHSSEREKDPYERSAPIKEFMAGMPKLNPDPFAKEDDLPPLLCEL